MCRAFLMTERDSSSAPKILTTRIIWTLSPVILRIFPAEDRLSYTNKPLAVGWGFLSRIHCQVQQMAIITVAMWKKHPTTINFFSPLVFDGWTLSLFLIMTTNWENVDFFVILTTVIGWTFLVQSIFKSLGVLCVCVCVTSGI